MSHTPSLDDVFAKLERERDAAMTYAVALRAAAKNFYAMVEGESPSLLEDDHNAFRLWELLQSENEIGTDQRGGESRSASSAENMGHRPPSAPPHSENAVGNPQRPSEEWYRRKIEGGEAPAVIGAAHLRGRDAIDEMVDRFLAWPLPATVCSDLCVTDPTYPHRIGTNLLTAPEARAMLEHVLQGCHSQGQRKEPTP